MNVSLTVPTLIHRAACLVALGLSLLVARGAALTTQSVSLQAGWNALWLEVQPTNDTPEVVFAGVPVEQVWTFRQRLPAVDYIADPSEPVWNRDQWLSWVPAGQPESIANSLFAIPGHRAYLVKATAAGTLEVTGRPSLRRATWKPDAFNLRGFPVDPGAPPTFREFFRDAPAHFDPAANAPRAIYTLSGTGTWELVAPTDLMQAGAAYWVYSQGGSSFVAPFEVRIEGGGETLDFARQVSQLLIQTINHRGTTVNATLGETIAPPNPALAYATFVPDTGREWEDLPVLLPQVLEARETRRLRLAAIRRTLPATTYESLIEIRDNQGTRFLLPVGIERLTAPDEARRHAGLWIGVASVSQVSEAHSGTLTTNSVASDGTPLEMERVGVSATPTPTRSAFPLRVLIHVDSDGTARLLREVTQMWEDGTYRVNADGTREVETPGRFVLLTDPAKFSQFKGVQAQGDAITGRRFSSVGFDFPGSGPGNSNNFVLLTGTFATGQNVSATMTLAESFATNPFRHKYHPDHDNLDARFTDFQAEAYAVVRAITLEFSAVDPGEGTALPDYGYSHLAGTYRETVTGLHRQPIHAAGTFRLRRVSEVAVLNP